MIGVYGDDSEDTIPGDKSAGLVVAAMCAAPDTQWDRFLPDWRGALKYKGLTGFHMEPFFNRKESAYRRWTEDEYAAQFRRVAVVIGNRTTIRLAVAVDKKKYRDWITRYAHRRPMAPVSSYTFAVSLCMMSVTAESDRRQIEQGLTYVMDAGAPDFRKAQAYVTDAYQRNMNDHRFRHWSSGLLPGNVRKFPQMQTADIFAYCVRELAAGRSSPRLRLYTDILYGHAPSGYFHIHTAEQFAAFEEQMDPIVQNRMRVRALLRRERRNLRDEQD